MMDNSSERGSGIKDNYYKESFQVDWADRMSSFLQEKIINLPKGENTDISAMELAIEILKNRPHYAKGKGHQKLKTLTAWFMSDANRARLQYRKAIDWVMEVRALYVPEFELLFAMRFFFSLAMIDQPLREQLYKDGFMDELVDDFEPDAKFELSSKGLEAFNVLAGADADGDDYMENSDDNPLDSKESDYLDRYYFADFVAKLLNQTPLNKGAFAVHLYAPWGAGKTSFMNFMKTSFNEMTTDQGKKQWYCIDFNAWQNQSMAYPWWAFMNNLYAELKTALPLRVRIKEWFWRFKMQRLSQAVALVVIGILLYFFGNAIEAEDKNKWLENISKFFGSLIAIWGLVISMSQNAILKSKKAAQDYLESKDNPMIDFKCKFKALIEVLRPSKIVVFIDDLDRCKSNYVVELLENLQTIFKEANVLFVIAADKTWLHASYEVEYEKIKGFIRVEGKTIGPLFIEKMFQLSIALPGVPEMVKEKCWKSMLKIRDVKTAPPVAESTVHQPTDNYEQFRSNHQQRIKSLETLSDQKTMRQTEHFLQPYGKYMDVNPRNMKRLLNNFLVNKAASLLSHIDIDKHQLVLYTIMSIQWPILAEYLLLNPETLDNIDTTPPEIHFLLKQHEIAAVINGRGFEKGLEKKTIMDCSLLFGFVGYSNAFNEIPKV